MIAEPELIRKLKGYFDLNIYETKVWLALLSKGISSAGEIAEISGVPRSRTYDVLESLEKRGFVIQKLGKPVKYIAVKPEIVIEKLKNNTTTSTPFIYHFLNYISTPLTFFNLSNVIKREFFF